MKDIVTATYNGVTKTATSKNGYFPAVANLCRQFGIKNATCFGVDTNNHLRIIVRNSSLGQIAILTDVKAQSNY